ncbi:MAG: hypothetical protein LBG15_12850 [Dysgonamonadaceae bacterium]|jgi:hypothetical protein|nr:hypothetical protein [Dysgonamonadaceae bacterium]
MDKKAFDALLFLKVQSIISLLMQRKALSFKEALHYLYSSELYRLLEKEETKVWHYNPVMLLDLVEREKETHHLTLPDYV